MGSGLLTRAGMEEPHEGGVMGQKKVEKYRLKRRDLERGLRAFFLWFLVLLPFPVRVLTFIPSEVCTLDILFLIYLFLHQIFIELSWQCTRPRRKHSSVSALLECTFSWERQIFVKYISYSL